MSSFTSFQLSDDRLSLLYRLSQTFNSSLDLDEVLNTVIDSVIATTRAERGFVILLEENGQIKFRAARGSNQTNIDNPEFQISRGVIDQVIREGIPILTSDAQMDSRFSAMQSVAFLGLTSVMCAPLKVKETTLGAVYVENRIQAGIFTENDLDLLNAIASSAAIAIDNARLYQVAVEKGRLERELQVARRVQASFLPGQVFQPPGWDIQAYLEPAREVGGDFYDVFPLNNSQRIGLVVADVCDKGVGSAMFMAIFRSLIRAYAERPTSPNWPDASKSPGGGMSVEEKRDLISPEAASLKAAISMTNNYIANNHGDSNMFATIFFGVLDPATGGLFYINAGHEPPILLGKGGKKERLSPSGPAVGLFPDLEFGIKQAEIEPGALLLAFTDGVLDAHNPEGETFGEERLLALIQEPTVSPAALLERINDSLLHHMGARPQFDDITLMALRRLEA